MECEKYALWVSLMATSFSLGNGDCFGQGEFKPGLPSLCCLFEQQWSFLGTQW